ncbi:hypothetical protein HUJ05_005023 [Dendroctonus ponderosae]|nr:hypothetical protein HUJ05_005023 [Dendroctonus ponderosae]
MHWKVEVSLNCEERESNALCYEVVMMIMPNDRYYSVKAQYYVPIHPWILGCQAVLTFFVLANFTLATFMDPGIIPQAPADEDRDDDFRAPLYKTTDINGIAVRMKWCIHAAVKEA